MTTILSIKTAKNNFRYRELAIVLCSILLVFLTGLSEHLSISHDSIFYLKDVIAGANSNGYFHPHHLLFMPAANIWYNLSLSLGITAEPHIIIESMNAVVGAITATLLYFLLRVRGQLPVGWSAIGTVLASFSFGFWYHSVCLEVCILPLMWFIASIIMVTAPANSSRGAAATGFFHALAILFHQVYLFLGIVILFGLWKRSASRRERLRHILVYLAVGVPLTLSVYGIAIVRQVHPLDSVHIWRWVTAYAYIGTETESHFYPPSAKTPVRMAIGETRAITPLYAVVKVPPLFHALKSILPFKHFDDEEFLYRNTSQWLAIAIMAGSSVILCVAIIAGVVGFRRRKYLSNAQRLAVQVCFASALVFMLFFSMWDSFNVEFWILQTTCLWLGVTILCGADNSSRKIQMILTITAGLIVTVNYLGAIRLLAEKHNDLYRFEADTLSENSRQGDILILDESYLLGSYMSRFSTRRTLEPYREILFGENVDTTFSNVRAAVDSTLAKGNNVIVFPYLLQVDERCPMSLDVAARIGGRDSLQRRLDSLWLPYRKRFVEQNPLPEMRYYSLRP